MFFIRFPHQDWLAIEKRLIAAGWKTIAGVDEAGRGPLAGPVVAAAVILEPDYNADLIVDSKQLTARQREEAADLIKNHSRAWALSASSAQVIDRIGILPATFAAMRRALARLAVKADYALIDGPLLPPDLICPAEAVPKGDGLSRSIAAASILAKVTRDYLMMKLDRLYPEYFFAANKGYGAAVHLQKLRLLGPCPHHRFSFRPLGQRELDIAL